MAKNSTPLEKTSASLFDAWKQDEQQVAVVSQADEIVSKRVSIWAIIALASGVVSLFSLLNLSFLFFAAFAVFAATFALLAIAKSGGELVGGAFAATGLALGIAGALAGPTRIAVFRSEYERQASEFCQYWFETAKKGDFLTLRQLEQPYWNRVPIANRDDEINYWKKFLDEEETHYGLHSFLSNPTLLTLAALGDRAKPTFYLRESILLTHQTEATSRIYAVTVEPEKSEKGGEKQTFFVRLSVDRNVKVNERGEKFVGWTARVSDWRPLELDKNGRPILDNKDD